MRTDSSDVEYNSKFTAINLQINTNRYHYKRLSKYLIESSNIDKNYERCEELVEKVYYGRFEKIMELIYFKD